MLILKNRKGLLMLDKTLAYVRLRQIVFGLFAENYFRKQKTMQVEMKRNSFNCSLNKETKNSSLLEIVG